MNNKGERRALGTRKDRHSKCLAPVVPCRRRLGLRWDQHALRLGSGWDRPVTDWGRGWAAALRPLGRGGRPLGPSGLPLGPTGPHWVQFPSQSQWVACVPSGCRVGAAAPPLSCSTAHGLAALAARQRRGSATSDDHLLGAHAVARTRLSAPGCHSRKPPPTHAATSQAQQAALSQPPSQQPPLQPSKRSRTRH